MLSSFLRLSEIPEHHSHGMVLFFLSVIFPHSLPMIRLRLRECSIGKEQHPLMDRQGCNRTCDVPEGRKPPHCIRDPGTVTSGRYRSEIAGHLPPDSPASSHPCGTPPGMTRRGRILWADERSEQLHISHLQKNSTPAKKVLDLITVYT